MKKVSLFIAVWVLSVSATLSAQTQQNAAPQPQSKSAATEHPEAGKSATEQHRPFTTQVKKTVVFLTAYCEEGGQVIKIQGTGFFVFVPDVRLGSDRGFAYLVTNRHVAEALKDDGSKRRILSTTVRLNLKQQVGGSQSEEGVLVFNSLVHWYFPSDDAVDLAIMPVFPDEEKYDFQTVSEDMFATPDVITSKGIVEGDPVLFAGFFYQYPGQKKIEPIVRQGILAMIPDEQLLTTLRKPGDVYLADAHVFGGNSGAPIFVNTSAVGLGEYKLLGVISGYYFETEDLRLEIATTLNGKLDANSGISLVVPAKELKALIHSRELQSIRDAEVARVQQTKTGK